jgi:serine O-acetyltransferase
MKKKPHGRCQATNREYAICHTAQALAPSFVMSGADQPESVLGNHPNPAPVIEALKTLIDVMFPGKFSAGPGSADELGIFLVRRLSEAWRLLRPEIERALPFRWTGAAARTEHRRAQPQRAHAEASRAMDAFYARLPQVRAMLVEDVRAAYEGDPAALTFAEVQLAYPGLLAIASHRLAHELYRLDVPIVPRIMSEWTHAQTGIDINPGARIGHGFFIDHGTGVVIGETAKIGNHVKLYQGVTLGAKSFPLDKHGHPIKHIQRHPTVEDNVVIYSNAAILGGDTVIGRGATIGGNVFLMESVPPNSLVTGKHPELKVKRRSAE